jgi:hypothetical protein
MKLSQILLCRKAAARFLAAPVMLGLLSLPGFADTVVWQTNFESPVAPGYYNTGDSVGSPNMMSIHNGAASVVSAPCLAASSGTISQCLQIISDPIQLYTTTNFGPGDYEISASVAGGSEAATVFVQLGAGNFHNFNVNANAPFTTYTNFESIESGQAAQFLFQTYPGVLLNSITITELSDSTAAAPEPSSWLLLSTALFAGIPSAIRRRRARRLATA